MDQGWKVVMDFMSCLQFQASTDAIYRGQPNWAWDIVPAVYRDKAAGIDDDAALQDWKQRAARFANPLPQTEIEWLMLAQHHGLETSLLDWTSNPLVALFFACDGEDEVDNSGGVWKSERQHFTTANHSMFISPFHEEKGAAYGNKPMLLNAVGRNNRSTAQDSIMSHHPFSDDFMLTADRIFDVKIEDKAPTLTALAQLGISGDRLMVDIARLVARMKADRKG